jgi:hypothetical protein
MNESFKLELLCTKKAVIESLMKETDDNKRLQLELMLQTVQQYLRLGDQDEKEAEEDE